LLRLPPLRPQLQPQPAIDLQFREARGFSADRSNKLHPVLKITRTRRGLFFKLDFIAKELLPLNMIAADIIPGDPVEMIPSEVFMLSIVFQNVANRG
jgi:hypothetical protein